MRLFAHLAVGCFSPLPSKGKVKVVTYGCRKKNVKSHCHLKSSYARGVFIIPSAVNVVISSFSRHEQFGTQQMHACWMADIMMRQFVHRMISSSIYRSRGFLIFALRTYHTTSVITHARHHVTSLGDLGLGDFAGLDSGLDS